jgi:hypothetical protein
VTTPLNDLTCRVALLSAPLEFTVTVRLLGGVGGGRLELRATRNACGGDAREYARLVTLCTVEDRGATAVAAAFVREARVALACTESPVERTLTRVRVRKARR